MSPSFVIVLLVVIVSAVLSATVAWLFARLRFTAEIAAERERSDTARTAYATGLAEARTTAEHAQRTAEIAHERALLSAHETMRAESESRAKTLAEQLAHDALARAASRLADAEQLAQKVTRRESAAVQKDAAVEAREAELARRERELGERERALQSRERESERLHEAHARVMEARAHDVQTTLERVAGLSRDEARREVIEQVVTVARASAAREARAIEDGAREEADKRAKRIVGLALQRYAGEHTSERAVTTIHLPSDDLKGKIIGREGRNIRAFQEATGCDLVVDDTPETIVISAFDPVRRETARVALEKLIADGRIHPTRIEECVARARDEVENAAREAADAAVVELGIGRVHPEILRLVGNLRYRYSYAQNVLRHSVEVGYLAGLVASEMGADVKLARRAGFLHDIGKAVSHEVEGGHAVVGAQYARKFGEDETVANAIAAHHEDEEARTLLAQIVIAADAISGARPGARREMLERYTQRLADLEKICAEFPGVERSYAIQAGREVRVIVEPSEVDDFAAAALSREIAKKIESEMAYPGQIRVTVVRETRAVDYAR